MPKNKAAARKAAAKYSTNPICATLEYARLTNQTGVGSIDVDRIRKLQDEMLSKLPLYRQPTNDEFTEYMLFYDPFGIKLNASGYQVPIFLLKLKERDIGDDLIAEIERYVKESELRIIELAQIKDELNEFKEKFTEAERIYNQNHGERSDKKNALVVQAIGLSTGKFPKRFNEKKIYFDYANLVRKDGLPREEAIKKIQNKHGIKTSNATLTLLYEYRSTLIKKWEEEHPSMLPEIRKRLEGFIPQKRTLL